MENSAEDLHLKGKTGKQVGDAFVNVGAPQPFVGMDDRKTGAVNANANSALKNALNQPGAPDVTNGMKG